MSSIGQWRWVLRVVLIGFFLGTCQTALVATALADSTPTATVQPGSATATPQPVPGRGFISGTVFQDDDGSETRNGREQVKSDITVWIELNSRTGDRQRTKTNRSGVYEFTGLAAGTYLVVVDPPDGFVTTTSTRLEVKVNGDDGTRLADFGVIRRSATPTPAPRVNDSRSNSSSSSGSSSGSNSRAGSDPSGDTVVQVAAPTATPPPPPPTATSTPTTAQQLAALTPIRSGRFRLEGRSDDNGRVADFAAEGNVLQPGDLDMRLTVNGEGGAVLIAEQKPFWRPASDDLWQPISLADLRAQHGLLSALDVISLPGLVNSVRDVRPGAPEQLDGQIVEVYEIELGPPTARPGAAASRPGQGGSGQAGTDQAGSGQFEPLGGLLRVWAGADDGLIRVAHLQAAVRSSRSDLVGRAEPARMDVWVRLSQHNTPFSIQAPRQIARPAPTPASAPVAAAAPPPARPANQPAPPPAPTPELRQSEVTTANVAAPAGEPVAQSGPAEQRIGDAQQALVALASSSGPRGGSTAEPDRIVLAVPQTTPPLDPSGRAQISDGVAALGMILDAYGVTIGMEDLEALSQAWRAPGKPGEPAQLETLVRIAERGSLRALGPSRGPGGGEWTAALAQDYLEQGYPVLIRVQPSLLSDVSPSAASQPDRYIVLTGLEGERLLYQDPTAADDEVQRILASQLDEAWARAALPRQGAAFGFGANVVGLLDATSRRAAQAATAVATATTIAPPTAVALPASTPIPALEAGALEASRGTVDPGPGWGLHPLLVGLFVLIACGVSFVLARLTR